MYDYMIYAIGYFISIVIGHFLILIVMKKLWKGLGYKKTIKGIIAHKEHPMMVGILERFLFTTSRLLGQSAFIAVWLALKVAGGWKEWNEEQEINGRKVSGRTVFNVFLIGNGFSIAYAIVGSLFIELSKTYISVEAIVIPSTLILGTVVFLLFEIILLKKRSNNPTKTAT